MEAMITEIVERIEQRRGGRSPKPRLPPPMRAPTGDAPMDLEVLVLKPRTEKATPGAVNYNHPTIITIQDFVRVAKKVTTLVTLYINTNHTRPVS